MSLSKTVSSYISPFFFFSILNGSHQNKSSLAYNHKTCILFSKSIINCYQFLLFFKKKKKNKFGASKKSFSFMSSIGADDFDFTPAATRSPNVERLLNHYTLPSEVLRDSLWQHSGLILPTSYRFPILASSSIFPLWREELLKLMVRIQDLYFLSEAPSRPIHPHQHLLPTSFQRSYWI